MREKLIIKNFGPIKSVDLDLGKMTILIGDNATGKSTIAKVLAVCRYFSSIVDCGYSLGFDTSFDDGLSYWGIFDYLNEETYIEYHGKEYNLNVKYEIKDWEHEMNEYGEVIGQGYPTYAGAVVTMGWQSDKFKNLVEKLNKSKPHESKTNPFKINLDLFNWKPSSSFFEIDVKQVMENPFYFPTERGLQSVFSLGRGKSLNDSLYEQLADLHNIAKFYSKPTTIEPFNIKYQNKDGNGYIESKEGKSFLLQNSASGYQSTIPIILMIKYYAENEKRFGRTYIIEEPETNLFPNRQKALIEFLVGTINKYDNQYIIPTHSPYILSVLNNLLLAYKKGKKGINLNPEICEVYQLVDGNSISILDKKLGLIDENIIDNASEYINDEFNDLLDI